MIVKCSYSKKEEKHPVHYYVQHAHVCMMGKLLVCVHICARECCLLSMNSATTQYETSGYGNRYNKVYCRSVCPIHVCTCLCVRVIDVGMDMHTCILYVHTHVTLNLERERSEGRRGLQRTMRVHVQFGCACACDCVCA